MKILVVEDDSGLANGIAFFLRREGCEVLHAGTLAHAKEQLEKEAPDAVLLDLNLPDGDGIDFCRKLREKSQTPVIMLTARDMETDEVQGLLSGADDYLTKPFSLAVLKARLDTVLRRSRERQNAELGQGGTEYERLNAEPGQSGTEREQLNTKSEQGTKRERLNAEPGQGNRKYEADLVCGSIRLDPAKMKVYCEGEEVDCSATEYRLLYYLMENRNQVLLKEQILAQVWDSAGTFVDESTLQTTIYRLRRKLNDDGPNPRYIRTVRGMGYIFAV